MLQTNHPHWRRVYAQSVSQGLKFQLWSEYQAALTPSPLYFDQRCLPDEEGNPNLFAREQTSITLSLRRVGSGPNKQPRLILPRFVFGTLSYSRNKIKSDALTCDQTSNRAPSC